MDAKLRELLTRLFIADAAGDENGYYDDGARVMSAVGSLRRHLESTGQWDWNVDAEPLVDAEEEVRG